MSRRRMLLAGTASPLTFRSTVAVAAGSAAVAKPAGVAVDDLVFVCTPFDNIASLTTTAGRVWNRFTFTWAGGLAYTMCVFWKQLDATDVANAWTLSGAPTYPGIACAYANPAKFPLTVFKRDEQNGTAPATTVSFAGTAPQGNSRGFFAFMSDRDGGSGGPTWTQPGTFTERADNGASTICSAFADALGTYGGAGITFTGTGVTADQAAMLLEATGT
jgi:hypothetical protein